MVMKRVIDNDRDAYLVSYLHFIDTTDHGISK